MQGHWALSYDSLNRLSLATTPVAIMGGVSGLCWQYDSFGNRIYQNLGSSAFSVGGTGSCSGGGTVTSNHEPVNTSTNQILSSSNAVISGGSGFTSATYRYDAAGNLVNDGTPGHSYAYDAESRVCAEATTIVGTGTVYYGYLYDAEGRRVVKGTISGGSLDGSGNVTAATCNLSTHAFTVTASYVIGPDGSTMTELDGSANWIHTDVPAGPGAMAVYDGSGLHFRLSDWLGSHRVQTSVDAATVEDIYQNLPFGEILNSPLGATRKHFTGKEHDDESGLDYFEARYFGSNMGRFVSPDWAAKAEPVPYAKLGDPQSLNLYSYVRNHPVTSVDADGHQESEEDVEAEAEQAEIRRERNALQWRQASPKEAERLGWPLSELSPVAEAFRQRYLSGSGGRWGDGSTTRPQNASLSDLFASAGYKTVGGVEAKEEWLSGPGGSKKGGTFVDLTVRKGNETIRIQTVTMTADGKLDPKEAAAAARITAKFPNDKLILVPKVAPRRPASSDPVIETKVK